MKIWHALNDVPGRQKSVVTIGNFDGMHQGHSRVIQTCVDRARRRGCESVALTFDPHPRSVHYPEAAPQLIMSLEDRLEAMSATGLDATFVANYDRNLYSLSPEDFVQEYLVERLGAVEVVVGEDFRFGRGNVGDVDTLRDLGIRSGFTVVMVTDIVSPSGRRWSSSWVRELLSEGSPAEAASVLGRFHRVTGVVEHGHKRGRELGVPTANLRVDPASFVPADGVYAGWMVRDIGGEQVGQEFLPSVISVGTNPQFGGTKRTVEAHVLGRTDLDLYDETVTLTFVRRLRPMKTFPSVEELIAQMDSDLLRTAATLGVRATGRVDPAAVTAGLQ